MAIAEQNTSPQFLSTHPAVRLPMLAIKLATNIRGRAKIV